MTAAPEFTAWPRPEGVEQGRELFDWAVAREGPRVCLVKGPEGSGKSRLLAWFLAGSSAAGGPAVTVHGAVPAEGLSTDVFAWELGRQLGYGPTSPDRLLNLVALDRRELFLLVPDLHRSGRGPAGLREARPEALAEDLIRHLLALEHVRAVVEVGDSGLLEDEEAQSIACADGPGRAGEEPARWDDLISAVPRTPSGAPDWTRAPEDVREQVLDQALREAAGRPTPQVLHLLSDPGYLVYGPARAITAAVADRRLPLPEGGRAIWQRAAPQLTATGRTPTERAALLHAAALGTNDRLAEYLRPLAEQNAWSAAWSRPGFPVAALGVTPDGAPELVAADALGRLVGYGPGGEDADGVPAAPRHLRPRQIAVRDRRSLLVLDDAGALHAVADPDDTDTHGSTGAGDTGGEDAGLDDTGTEDTGPHDTDAEDTGAEDTGAEDTDARDALARIAAHHGAAALTSPDARATALGGAPDGRYAVVGDGEGRVHIWSLHDPAAGPRTMRLHSGRVLATACLPLPGRNLDLVFSAGQDGSIRLWEASADPMPEPVTRRPATVTALAAADTPAGPLLAAAWNDGEVHVRHVLSGTSVIVPLPRPADALAFTRDGLLAVGDPYGVCAMRFGPEAF